MIKVNKQQMKFLIAANEYTRDKLEKAGAIMLSSQPGYYVLSNTCDPDKMMEFSHDKEMRFLYSNIMCFLKGV